MLTNAYYLRVLPILLLIFLVGCHSAPIKTHPILGVSERDISGYHILYTTPGPYDHVIEKNTFETTSSCNLKYRRFVPIEKSGSRKKTDDQPIIFIMHGLYRPSSTMQGYGAHLASRGMETVVLEPCSLKLPINVIKSNAQDILDLSNHFDKKIIYIGYSGGGLSTVLAAEQYQKAKAFLGLDAGGWGDIGLREVKDIDIPFAGIFGPPKAFNIFGKGAKLASLNHNIMVHYIPDSRHCHYENPDSNLCHLICGKGEVQKTRKQINKDILTLVTAFSLWQIGLDSKAVQVWNQY